eukprot:TRINITY_DN9457_c0_g1_i2.p1 TRINITY_DN9457_c0_g1~~TRINITY_DN9457_c0_g1_i2.p1  ORF type:complete len:311 (-),score=0.44 TRINITY_DN9457_c0_g1_i2:180-1112(-)
MCLVCIIRGEQVSEGIEPSGSEQSQKEEHDLIYYFAIGSMTHPTALALRNLRPVSSEPAELKGWTLKFLGSGGMASAEPIDDEAETLNSSTQALSSIHGVLHLLSVAQMKELDRIEGGYHRRPCVVTTYSGMEIHAYVYQMEATRAMESGLPTQRYVDIISHGCTYYGVAPHWIAWLQSHPRIDRKPPSLWNTFEVLPTTPTLSWEEIRVNDGQEGRALWIVINYKVIEFVGDRSSFFPFGYFVRHRIGGTDYTVRFARGFFEPLFQLTADTKRTEEMEPDHRRWVEDQFLNPPPSLEASKWVLVGIVDN